MLLYVASCIWSMQAQVHPAEPVVNLGNTSFLDGLGGPGLLIEEIGVGMHSAHATNSTGQIVASSPSTNSLSGVTHVAWTSQWRFLGAWYGVEVLAVAAHVDAGPGGSVSGSGDLTVSPLILQWKELKIGPMRLQQRTDLGLDLPVGQYNQRANVSLSSHSLGIEPHYAFTLFPVKKLETSWRIHYLWNGVNYAPPLSTGVRSTQAGQAIHFNATLGYSLPHGFWVGANGYYLKQTTAPKINGLPLRNSAEQIGAIGPGIVWDRGRYLFYVNTYHEVGAENRSAGNRLVLRVEWLPNNKPGTGDH